MKVPSTDLQTEIIHQLQEQIVHLQNELTLMTENRDVQKRVIDDYTKTLRDLHTKSEAYRKLILELFEGR